MGESFITRKGGAAVDTTAAPTITEVSKTDTSITFTVTNNDAATATVYYDFDDEVTSLSEDNVTLATTATSNNIEVTGLTAETQYTIYSVASAFNKMFSPQTLLAITTDATPLPPQYELLYEETVATAKTQIDITGLNIGKDDTLRLVYTLVGDDAAANSLISLLPNNQTTLTNYHMQELGGAASSAFAARSNTNRIAYCRSTIKSQGFVDIKVSNNDRFVMQSQYMAQIGGGSSSLEHRNENNVGSGFTLTSITSLSIVSNRTNGIAVGSKIALYKVTEAA